MQPLRRISGLSGGDSLYFNTTSSTYSWGNKNRTLYRIIEGDAFLFKKSLNF